MRCKLKLSRRLRGRVGFTLVELLVVMGIIALLIGILMPVISRAREQANRVKCASNPRQIGLCMSLYANDNQGRYPRVLYNGIYDNMVSTDCVNSSLTSSFDPALVNNIPAAIFLLIREGYASPNLFICPSDPNAAPDPLGGQDASDRTNFTGIKRWVMTSATVNLSYSFADMYCWVTDEWFNWTSHCKPDFAVAADLNPGWGLGGNQPAATPTSSGPDMRAANSKLHKLDGQNVLFGDGHVSFCDNPCVGVNRDNIYTVTYVPTYGSPMYNVIFGDANGVNSYICVPDDSYLLPYAQ